MYETKKQIHDFTSKLTDPNLSNTEQQALQQSLQTAKGVYSALEKEKKGAIQQFIRNKVTKPMDGVLQNETANDTILMDAIYITAPGSGSTSTWRTAIRMDVDIREGFVVDEARGDTIDTFIPRVIAMAKSVKYQSDSKEQKADLEEFIHTLSSLVDKVPTSKKTKADYLKGFLQYAPISWLVSPNIQMGERGVVFPKCAFSKQFFQAVQDCYPKLASLYLEFEKSYQNLEARSVLEGHKNKITRFVESNDAMTLISQRLILLIQKENNPKSEAAKLLLEIIQDEQKDGEVLIEELEPNVSSQPKEEITIDTESQKLPDDFTGFLLVPEEDYLKSFLQNQSVDYFTSSAFSLQKKFLEAVKTSVPTLASLFNVLALNVFDIHLNKNNKKELIKRIENYLRNDDLMTQIASTMIKNIRNRKGYNDLEEKDLSRYIAQGENLPVTSRKKPEDNQSTIPSMPKNFSFYNSSTASSSAACQPEEKSTHKLGG